jgi:exopolysaccharide biosynthesis protein
VTSRTVAGLSKNRRTLTLVTVDGRGGVAGLTPAEIATRLARDFGVWDALNLDGGGSTAMAWRDPATGQPALLNTPTDGPRGRAVASSLAVFARPAPTGPAPRP